MESIVETVTIMVILLSDSQAFGEDRWDTRLPEYKLDKGWFLGNTHKYSPVLVVAYFLLLFPATGLLLCSTIQAVGLLILGPVSGVCFVIFTRKALFQATTQPRCTLKPK